MFTLLKMASGSETNNKQTYIIHRIIESNEKTIDQIIGYENVTRRGPREPAEYKLVKQVIKRQSSQYKQSRAIDFNQYELTCALEQQVSHRAEKSDICRSDTDTIVTVDP